MNEQYCNNCGKQGHLYNQCKIPITSSGIISYRYHNNKIEFLMIRRRHTLGFIDFMRGKYSINDKSYIINMFKQMTVHEKNNLKSMTFEELWADIWGDETISIQYKSEENISKDKLMALRNGIHVNNEHYSIDDIIKISNNYPIWEEAEWGFPKGRRNFKEKDYDCAIREYCEESGYAKKHLCVLQNISPFEEIFTGSNYKSYKHKYFIAYLPYDNTLIMDNYEKAEVSKIGWYSIEDCLKLIRNYNEEKKNVLTKVSFILNNYYTLQI
jgi:8-oxo-dGTP pyrophosphatase MutT (NUDIX family)